MMLRLRIQSVTPRHVRCGVFEARDHGPNLGFLTFDRKLFEQDLGEAEEGRKLEVSVYVPLAIPGSGEARAQGCICDPNQEGPRYRVEKACPVHGLAEVKAMLDEREEL